jgi:hypothetical protein
LDKGLADLAACPGYQDGFFAHGFLLLFPFIHHGSGPG